MAFVLGHINYLLYTDSHVYALHNYACYKVYQSQYLLEIDDLSNQSVVCSAQNKG